LASVLLGFGLANFPPFTLNVHGKKPKFGSPEDVKKAIQELRAALVDEALVSTNSDDLHVHGFSPNDHHQGKLFFSFWM
jgi:D-lactate dehydrogenase (cytochrome)